MALDTKQHPIFRSLSDAVAYTVEEGGVWYQGEPLGWGRGVAHTVLWADGWALDDTLSKKGVNRGARRVDPMPVFVNGVSQPIVMDVNAFDKKPKFEPVWTPGQDIVELKERVNILEIRRNIAALRVDTLEQRIAGLEHRAAGGQQYGLGPLGTHQNPLRILT